MSRKQAALVKFDKVFVHFPLLLASKLEVGCKRKCACVCEIVWYSMRRCVQKELCCCWPWTPHHLGTNAQDADNGKLCVRDRQRVSARLTVAWGAALRSCASRLASALLEAAVANISTRDGCMYASATPATMATDRTPATTAVLRVCRNQISTFAWKWQNRPEKRVLLPQPAWLSKEQENHVPRGNCSQCMLVWCALTWHLYIMVRYLACILGFLQVACAHVHDEFRCSRRSGTHRHAAHTR
jgi:hypothetical protein